LPNIIGYCDTKRERRPIIQRTPEKAISAVFSETGIASWLNFFTKKRYLVKWDSIMLDCVHKSSDLSPSGKTKKILDLKR